MLTCRKSRTAGWGGLTILVAATMAGCGVGDSQPPSAAAGQPVVTASETPQAPVAPTPSPEDSPTETPSQDTVEIADDVATLNDESNSLVDPMSIWVIVNKRNPVSQDFRPDDLVVPDMTTAGSNNQLRAVAASALVALSQEAQEAVGQPLQLTSGFRSFDTQTRIYNNFVAQHGQERADTFSARPGHSEHQTGLAADVTTVGGTLGGFGDTELGRWTTENSWRYGFIVRYTEENQHITGYIPEPWHLRYVGENMAEYYHNTNALALENVFGFPPAPDYGED